MVNNWRRGRRTNNGQRKMTEEAKGDLNWIMEQESLNDLDPSWQAGGKILSGGILGWYFIMWIYIFQRGAFLVQSIIATFWFIYVNLEGVKVFIILIILSWNFKQAGLIHRKFINYGNMSQQLLLPNYFNLKFWCQFILYLFY